MEIVFAVIGLLLIVISRFTKGLIKLCIAIVGSVGVIVGCLDNIGVGFIIAGVVCAGGGVIQKKIRGRIINDVSDVVLLVLGIIEIILGFVIGL